MVGNHVADIVARYGESSAVPTALTEYIKGREGYDYNEHGQAGNVHTEFVPDEIIDRFCILGPVEEHVRRLEELKALGVHQFAVYLQHDARTDSSLRREGHPAIADTVRAKTDARSSGLDVRARAGLVGACGSSTRSSVPRTAGPCSAGNMPRANDTAMPHVWEMFSRYGQPENRASDTPILVVVLRGAWFTFRIALAGLALGTAVGLGLAVLMARYKVVERGLLPYLVLSQTVPLIALAPSS